MALQWALALSLMAGVLAQQTAEENCAQSIDGGRWDLVRHTYNKWFKATDGLTGTASYGDSSDGPLSTNEWAIPFDAEDSTEFLFSDGDCDRWMITTYDQFAYHWGSNYDATILKSHISDTPYVAKWYNRGNSEDPWISYQDHWDNNRLTNMYGENSYGGNAAYSNSHMNVWMRSDATDSPTKGPTSSPTKTPTAEPSPEPTADPVRDCDVLHIDEFLVDCSVEFEGHDNDIDSLKSDVTTLKDDVTNGEAAIVALEGTVDNLVNSTSTMDAAIQELEYILSQAKAGHDALEAVVNVLVNSSSAADESIDEIKADIQVIMEQLGKIGDLPAAASVIGGNMDWYQQSAGDSMVLWNGTDMMIAGLVIANVVTMIVLAVVCCGNGSSDKHRYGVVEVGSD